MPAGVSWPRYLRMLGASVVSMFLGAQAVHQYYRPDLSIPDVPPKPGELKTELLGCRAKDEAHSTLQHPTAHSTLQQLESAKKPE